MKEPTPVSDLPISDLEEFAVNYLGLDPKDFDIFYEQYYHLNPDDELDVYLDGIDD